MPISRGEVWLVNLDPTIGAKIQKTRPVIMISSDAVGLLPLKLVAPLTKWKDHLVRNGWQVKVVPDPVNGLTIDTHSFRSWKCLANRYASYRVSHRGGYRILIGISSQPVLAADRADVCLMEAL